MSKNRFDCHHTLFDRVSWEARPQAEALRENTSLKVQMARTAHNLLHYMTAPVPVPGIHTLNFVAQRMESGLDIISGIDRYSSLVESSLRHPKTKFVERELGELSITALRAQIPYIIDGLPAEQRRHFV